MTDVNNVLIIDEGVVEIATQVDYSNIYKMGIAA
jgi:hypothetical protein